MIALDTNLLVRALVADNPEQVAVVRRLIAGDSVFISCTVLLETDNTVIETSEAVGNALDWYAQGADFADALHLAACGTTVMHTFDPDFCKASRRRCGRGRFETIQRQRPGTAGFRLHRQLQRHGGDRRLFVSKYSYP